MRVIAFSAACLFGVAGSVRIGTSIAITPKPFKPSRKAGPRTSNHPITYETRSDFRRYRLRPHLRRIGGIACRPDACFATFDRNRRADQEAMLDIKARPAKLADMGREFDDIAKAGGSEKAGAGIHQR